MNEMIIVGYSGKMKGLFEEYQKATQEERNALELRYGKIFNRLMDEMASMDTITRTAKQCPTCSIFVDVCSLFRSLHIHRIILFAEIGRL